LTNKRLNIIGSPCVLFSILKLLFDLKKYWLFLPPLSIFLLFVQCDDGNPYKQGKILYTNFCANCHMEDGSGLKGLIPPLAKSDYLATHRGELVCVIRKGQKGQIVVNGVEYGQQEMLAIPKLSDFEITNVLNFISQEWGNQQPTWTVEEVREGLKKCN
jgi:cytochrome c